MNLPSPQVHLQPERGALPMGGGTVRALLRIEVGFPAAEREREPISLALVIDRSGSMSGEPLAHAKASAIAAVRALRDDDRVAVVAYDDTVLPLVPSVAVGEDRRPIERAIAALRAGNTTALHAGWVEGCSQVLTAPVASGRGRVVLLSDGLANVGITDPAAIAEDVARVTADGVTTSTIGLGRRFDERLMRHLADAGQGSFVFVESPEQLEGLFETELAGMSALRGRDVRLRLNGSGVRIVASLGGGRLDRGSDDPHGGGVTLRLPDLIAGLPRELLLTLQVAPGGTLTGLRLNWDDLFTRRSEALEVDLDVPTLPDAEYRGRPPVDAVASAVRVADLATDVARVEGLVRSNRLAEAEESLATLDHEVAAWPADAARDAQLADLSHLLEAVRRRDADVATKRAYAALYEREAGVRVQNLKAMAAMEREWTDAHKATTSRPAAPRREPPAGEPPPREPPRRTPARREPAHEPASFRLLRPDGSRARVEVALGDLTDQAVDAIVNPSNRGLFGTAGVDGAVHRRGGPQLTAACRQIGGIKYGQAVVTPGFRLPAGRVIHTATHPWKGGRFGELDTLRAAYAASFDVARRLRARSLALPAIGTGFHGYPPDVAAEVAVDVALRELLLPGELELVRFVLFDVATADLFRRTLSQAMPAAAGAS